MTEDAFSRPTFVEDVVRNVASRLADHPHVSGFRVEVESYESIHAHNAFACIEHGVTLKGIRNEEFKMILRYWRGNFSEEKRSSPFPQSHPTLVEPLSRKGHLRAGRFF